MNARRLLFATLALGVLASACGDGEEEGKHNAGSGGTQATGGAAGAAGEPIDPLDFVKIQKSCAYNCPLAICTEKTTPYVCQNGGDLERQSPTPKPAELGRDLSDSKRRQVHGLDARRATR